MPLGKKKKKAFKLADFNFLNLSMSTWLSLLFEVYVYTRNS